MREKEWKYDAFISYCHKKMDMEVAKKLQTLLENYKPPKGTICTNTDRIRRIFRDQSELPTSGDLGTTITEALAQSDFLIVVCSQYLGKSAWCMEEIRKFKELHDGKTDHILPVLIEGEPKDVFPKELCYEIVKKILPDGTETRVERKVDPIGADIRAKTNIEQLKKLKTEFLRPAASILGCEFDMLFQRQRRRKVRRMKYMAAGASVVLTAVLIVVSLFAWRATVAEKKTRAALSNTLMKMGGANTETNHVQQALAYYAGALSMAQGGTSSASTGAAILLQNYAWPYYAGETEGTIQNGQLASPEGEIVHGRKEAARYIASFADTEICINNLTGDRSVTIEIPKDIHPDLAGEDELMRKLYQYTCAVPVSSDRALLARGGYLYIYDISGETGILKSQMDCANIFPQKGSGAVHGSGELWSDPEGTRAVYANGFSVAFLDLRDDILVSAVIPQYKYALNDVILLKEKGKIALAYGNQQAERSIGSGGYAAVYEMDGTPVYESALNPAEPVMGLDLSENGSVLLTYSIDTIRIWDLEEKREAAAPLILDRINSALLGEDGNSCIVDVGGSSLRTYRFLYPVMDAEYEEETEESVSTDMDNELCSRLKIQKALGNLDLRIRKDGILSQDRETLYTIAHSYQDEADYLISFGVDYQKKTISDPQIMDCRNYTPQQLWCNHDRLIVQAAGNQLLIYNKGKLTPAALLIPEGSGWIQEAAVNEDGSLAAIVLFTQDAAVNDLSLDSHGVVELWDMVSGIRIGSFGDKKNTISRLAFNQEGNLQFLLANEKKCVRMPSMALPDRERQVLEDISCYCLDNEQNLVKKEPVFNESEGQRSAFLSTDGTLVKAEEKDTVIETVSSTLNGYYSQLGYRGVPEAYRLIEEQMIDGRLVTDLHTDDMFYRSYVEDVCTFGTPEDIQSAVESYIARIDRAYSEGEDLNLVFHFDAVLPWSMQFVNHMDGEIIHALETFEDQIFQLPENAEIAEMGEQCTLLMRSLLSGNRKGAQTILESGEFDRELIPSGFICAGLLMNGDSDQAAVYLDQYKDTVSVDVLNYDMEHSLGMIYAMVQRGYVLPGDVDRCIALSDFQTGLKVNRVGEKGMKYGFYAGDFIYQVRGARVYSVKQFYDLIYGSEGAECEIDVLRDGQTATVVLPARDASAGKFKEGFLGDLDLYLEFKCN